MFSLSLGELLRGFPFIKVLKFTNLAYMAKASKKTINIKTDKTPEQGSALFHNIMAASVQGNPKPAAKKVAKKK